MANAASRDPRSEYGTEEQVADYLGLARVTAQTRRLKGKDWPPAYKFGRRVMYRWTEVDTWAESRRLERKKAVQP